MRLAVALTLLGLGLGGCKGDARKCETACRNYAPLLYWKVADAEIAAAPADQRDRMRKHKLAEFDSKLENGVDDCVTKCQSANNEKQIDCISAAKTADAAEACVN